ncbi:MAG: hypothetical protein ACXWTW_10255 [Methylobacter sp.]
MIGEIAIYRLVYFRVNLLIVFIKRLAYQTIALLVKQRLLYPELYCSRGLHREGYAAYSYYPGTG